MVDAPTVSDKDTYPPLGQLLKAGLKGRLMGGACPRYQISNPVDLDEAFTKFEAESTMAERRMLIQDMWHHQSMIREQAGGHPSAVLIAELLDLARRHNVEGALLAVMQAELNPRSLSQ